jgi:tryptophan-rich sensory protein
MPGLWPFFVLIILIFAALAIASAVAWRKFGIRGLLTGLAGYLLVLLIAELVIGVVFFTFGKFIVKGAGKKT